MGQCDRPVPVDVVHAPLCQPLNPFGSYAASPEAQDFITERLTDELEVEQFVLNVTAGVTRLLNVERTLRQITVLLTAASDEKAQLQALC